MINPWGQINTRDELIGCLREAAEIEQAVCCQYLFNAFSIRASDGSMSGDEANFVWYAKRTLLQIARQEMNHLGLVANVIAAVGGGPHFQLPSFPIHKQYEKLTIDLELTPLSVGGLRHFIALERPLGLDGPEAAPSVAGLTHQLRELTKTMNKRLKDSQQELFIGDPDQQVDNQKAFGISNEVSFYDLNLATVQDAESAKAVFDTIVTQGEGSATDPDVLQRNSHFNALRELERRLLALQKTNRSFRPAWPVVSNPSLTGAPGTNAIAKPLAQLAVGLFDSAYGILISGLTRFYAPATDSDDQIEALRGLLFFPLMTMVIRPIGDLLPLLDAGNGTRAAPTFVAPGSTEMAGSQAYWVTLPEKLDAIAAGCEMVAVQVGGQRLEWSTVAKNVRYLAQTIRLQVDS